MYIIVKLNPGQGEDLGPDFQLTANVGVVSPSTATLDELLVGVPAFVNNSATQIFVTSEGICTNILTLNIITGTTTTTTTTTSTSTSTTTASPTTTTTAAPTTTTTTPSLYYYNVDKVNCPGCTTAEAGIIAISPTLKTNNFYYNIGDGYVYKVNFGTGVAIPNVDLTGAASAGTDCAATCAL
jgi:hypothetical protein